MNDTALAPSQDGVAPGLDRLQRSPIIDTIDPRTLALIQKQIAPGCTLAEVGHFLELCTHYDLDPFAREAWCAKSKKGQLLIMVGRDGLRRIGQRNGLHIDCDVVRANDDFTVCRTPDGNRTVAHSYGPPKDRGPIVGAWAECRRDGLAGDPAGYFFAPIEEYRPKGASEYSPWSKQEGVMILAAAERQAIRQATPLSGLLAAGEDESIAAQTPNLSEGVGTGEPLGEPLPPEVVTVIERAKALGHAGLSDVGAVEMAVLGQPADEVEAWVKAAHVTLDAMPAHGDDRELDDTGEPVDAEVVDEPDKDAPACMAPDPSRAGTVCELPNGHEGHHRADEEAWDSFLPDADAAFDAGLARELEEKALTLMDAAEAYRAQGLATKADAREAEAEKLIAQARGLSDPAQAKTEGTE